MNSLPVNIFYQGDCIDVMRERLPANSIDLVVTSPPYFLNKEYERTWSYEYYCELMRNTFEQVFRVLRPGRYFVINFGDYFNSGNRFYEADVPSVYPASVNMFQWGREAGFDLQATRIWRKQFARMRIPFVCNAHPRNVFDYEHIWTFRKPNGSKQEFVNDRRLSQRGVIGEDWTSSAELAKHYAAFPVDLPEWAIKVYTEGEGEIVLDPYMGSGTTALAAMNLGRKFIGIELKPEFVDFSIERVRSKERDENNE